VHVPSLAVALLVMVAGTLYPPLMANAASRADHGLAMALFWAMSAGFVRGVGFVPRALPWRWLFSGWACAAALGVALLLKLQH
jgi:predicted membrane protein